MEIPLLQTRLIAASLALVCCAGALRPVVAADEPAFDTAAAQAVVARVVPSVERIRRLAFKAPVPVTVVDSATAREYMLRRLEAFDQTEHNKIVEQVYALLGLVPDGTDLTEILLEALDEQAAGFYDPDSGAYVLLDSIPPELAAVFTAHELTHALEDQHFDLDARLHADQHDDDRLFAHSAVHEGSATLMMVAYLARSMAAGDAVVTELQSFGQNETARGRALEAYPVVLLRHLLGPYVLGAQFLTRGDLMSAALGYPSASIDRAYEDAPLSSEQILHPEKYWDPDYRDDPEIVPASEAATLMGRFRLEGQGVLGELLLGMLVGAETPIDPAGLGPGLAAAWTNAAATGWGGDRWELWRRGRSRVLLLQTIWDTEEDAREFAAALEPRAGLEWRVAGRRVAIVSGKSRRKAARLLDHLLEPARPSL